MGEASFFQPFAGKREFRADGEAGTAIIAGNVVWLQFDYPCHNLVLRW